LNVLVQGSLRDEEWHRQRFLALRATAPHYRIAIVSVTAPRDVVLQRVARRAQVTGRDVPLALIDAALEAAPRSVAALSSLADAVFHISNAVDGAMPIVLPPHTPADVSRTFADACAVPTTPRASTAQVTDGGEAVGGAGTVPTEGAGHAAGAPFVYVRPSGEVDKVADARGV